MIILTANMRRVQRSICFNTINHSLTARLFGTHFMHDRKKYNVVRADQSKRNFRAFELRCRPAHCLFLLKKAAKAFLYQRRELKHIKLPIRGTSTVLILL